MDSKRQRWGRILQVGDFVLAERISLQWAGLRTEDVHESQDQACQIDDDEKKVAAVTKDDLCVFGEAKVENQHTRLHQS